MSHLSYERVSVVVVVAMVIIGLVIVGIGLAMVAGAAPTFTTEVISPAKL
jgi:hypothetical protein